MIKHVALMQGAKNKKNKTKQTATGVSVNQNYVGHYFCGPTCSVKTGLKKREDTSWQLILSGKISNKKANFNKTVINLLQDISCELDDNMVLISSWCITLTLQGSKFCFSAHF